MIAGLPEAYTIHAPMQPYGGCIIYRTFCTAGKIQTTIMREAEGAWDGLLNKR